MSWSAPMTAVAGATFTAAQFNQYVRDLFLECPTAKATAAGQHFVSSAVNTVVARSTLSSFVATSETTTSTSYADLATIGPAVTITTGTSALVWWGASISNTGANSSRMSMSVGGASSVAASDQWAAIVLGTSAFRIFSGHLFTGLTAGSNVFVAKYSVAANTGTFINRELIVHPL